MVSDLPSKNCSFIHIEMRSNRPRTQNSYPDIKAYDPRPYSYMVIDR